MYVLIYIFVKYLKRKYAEIKIKPGQPPFITAQKPKTKKNTKKKSYFYVKTMHISVIQIVVRTPLQQ